MRWPVLTADCPLAYQNWSDAKNGASRSNFSVMSTEDLCRLDVGSLAADNALLFLWATWPKLLDCLQIMEAWGFRYITCPFVWGKIYSHGGPYVGLGFWSRSQTEFVLLGKRGKGVSRQKTATNVKQRIEELDETITAPVIRPHSRKPHEVPKRIDELVGPEVPKLELFARGDPEYLRLPQWAGTGLEYDGMKIEDFIERNRESRT